MAYTWGKIPGVGVMVVQPNPRYDLRTPIAYPSLELIRFKEALAGPKSSRKKELRKNSISL